MASERVPDKDRAGLVDLLRPPAVCRWYLASLLVERKLRQTQSHIERVSGPLHIVEKVQDPHSQPELTSPFFLHVPSWPPPPDTPRFEIMRGEKSDNTTTGSKHAWPCIQSPDEVPKPFRRDHEKSKLISTNGLCDVCNRITLENNWTDRGFHHRIVK